jgi:hypothetical protein
MSFGQAMEAADLTLLEIFGDVRSVGGKNIYAVIDEDEYRARQARKQQDYAEGIWGAGLLLFCRLEDLGYRPEKGSLLTVEGKEWTVSEVACGEKLLEITLESNES